MRRPPPRFPKPRDAQPVRPPTGSPDTRWPTRADALPERRLLRLQHLVRGLPDDQRMLHWDEAQWLSARAGDTGRLLLVGFACRLPLPLEVAARHALLVAVGNVQDLSKRALAYLALAEAMPLEAHELHDATALAMEIPDVTLRIMILTQLARRAR